MRNVQPADMQLSPSLTTRPRRARSCGNTATAPTAQPTFASTVTKSANTTSTKPNCSSPFSSTAFDVANTAATATCATPSFITPHRPLLITSPCASTVPSCRRQLRTVQIARVPAARTRISAVALAGRPGRPRGASTSSSSPASPTDPLSVSPPFPNIDEGDELDETDLDNEAQLVEEDHDDIDDDIDDDDPLAANLGEMRLSNLERDPDIALGFTSGSTDDDFDDNQRIQIGGQEPDENDELPEDFVDVLRPLSRQNGDDDDAEQDPALAFDPDSDRPVTRKSAAARSRARQAVRDNDLEDEVGDDDDDTFLSSAFSDGDDEPNVLTNPGDAATGEALDGDDDMSDLESDEDLQNAANILSDRGLLGLGVDGAARSDMASVSKFALGGPHDDDDQDLVDKTLGLDTEDDEDEDDDVAAAAAAAAATVQEEEEEEEEEEDDSNDLSSQDEEKDSIDDDYPDLDDDEDDLRVTSQSSIGKVWELNEDTHVTITEAGESYMYELDEEDQEDQEMASVRRGKQGGWSGGAMASYPATDLPEGSEEWKARRMYELLSQSSPVEMFRWTRSHRDPPSSIVDLYEEELPPADPPGRATLEMVEPSTEASIVGTMRDPSYYEDSMGSSSSSGSQSQLSSSMPPQNLPDADREEDELAALGRAINFPCAYKFKVEGIYDDPKFVPAVREVVESLLGREIDDKAFQTDEPEGRYQRLNITVDVVDAKQLSSVHDALRNCPSVKFSYG